LWLEIGTAVKQRSFTRRHAMDRAMNQGDNLIWDFIYQAVVIGLGVSAGVAIYMQITGV
jgi:hypothetical protein